MSTRLDEMADAVRRALAEKHLIDNRIGIPEGDDIDDALLSGARSFAYRSEDALSKRAVIAVAKDRRNDAVVIYTSRAYSQADQKVMREVSDETIPIIFRSLDVGPQGPGAASQIQIASAPVLVQNRISCGSSISVGNDRGAGTMGALVRDSNGNLFGLSCGHVIAGCGYLRKGMPIVAPGIQDVVPGWPDPRVIGHFARALPLIPGDPATIGVQANLDAALFRVENETVVSSSQGGRFDTPTDVHILDEENDEGTLDVEKVGRTTGFTQGTMVTRFLHPFEIEFKITCFPELGMTKKFEASVFIDQLWAANSGGAPFASPGDSGALVVTRPMGDAPRRAVGLIVAGTRDNSAMVLPIQPILDAFGVTLVAGHGV